MQGTFSVGFLALGMEYTIELLQGKHRKRTCSGKMGVYCFVGQYVIFEVIAQPMFGTLARFYNHYVNIHSVFIFNPFLLCF